MKGRIPLLLVAFFLVLVATACTDYPVHFNEPLYHVSPIPYFPPEEEWPKVYR